jgi:SAM-dependent methyltransferase
VKFDDISLQNFNQTRKICGSLYYDFFKSKNVFEKIINPTTPERLCYEMQWSDRSLKIIYEILHFLQEFGVVNIAGETVTNGTQLEFFAAPENRILKGELGNNSAYQFVKYGLELLDALMEGDLAEWDLTKRLYTYESGIFYPVYSYIQVALTEKLREIISQNQLPQILMLGQFIEWFITPISNLIEEPDQITILTLNDEDRDRCIAFLEVDNRTSKFSNQVKTLENNELKPDSFDMVFSFDIFSIIKPAEEWIKLINKKLKPNGIFLFHNSDYSTAPSGIEPLLWLNKNTSNLHTMSEIKNILKLNGFSETKEDLILPSLAETIKLGK